MFIEPLDTSRLGAKVEKDGVSFGLWAPHAKRVELSLVDLMKNQRNVEMREDGRGIWHAFVPGIGEGQEYGYRVHGDWAPSAAASSSRASSRRRLARCPARCWDEGLPTLPSSVSSASRASERIGEVAAWSR